MTATHCSLNGRISTKVHWAQPLRSCCLIAGIIYYYARISAESLGLCIILVFIVFVREFLCSFSIAARRLSGLLRDQLESPLERAVFWTEYVIRHNGSMDHLRLGSRKLAPYQRSLIDVYLVLVLIASLPLWLVFLCLRCCWSTNKTKAATAMSKKSKQE